MIGIRVTEHLFHSKLDAERIKLLTLVQERVMISTSPHLNGRRLLNLWPKIRIWLESQMTRRVNRTNLAVVVGFYPITNPI